MLVNPGYVYPSTVADDGYNMTFRLQVVKGTLNLVCLHDVAMRRGSLVYRGWESLRETQYEVTCGLCAQVCPSGPSHAQRGLGGTREKEKPTFKKKKKNPLSNNLSGAGGACQGFCPCTAWSLSISGCSPGSHALQPHSSSRTPAALFLPPQEALQAFDNDLNAFLEYMFGPRGMCGSDPAHQTPAGPPGQPRTRWDDIVTADVTPDVIAHTSHVTTHMS